MFWGDGADTINYFVELTQQMRIEDPWYSAFLDQCRRGYLDDEMYNFILGLPTEHCGSWLHHEPSACVIRHERESSAANCRTGLAQLPHPLYRLERKDSLRQAWMDLPFSFCKLQVNNFRQVIENALRSNLAFSVGGSEVPAIDGA